MELTYTKVGDYYIPNLIVSEEKERLASMAGFGKNIYRNIAL